MERAFADAARADEDRSALDVAPLLGRWRQPVLATHALISGRPLGEVSTKDYPSDEFGDNYFVAGGYGAYIARLARGLPIALGEPVRVIDTTGAGVSIETVAGARIEARAAVLTVPVPLLQAGGITFRPGLPESHRDALTGFLAGTYEHVILNWPDLPLRGADRLAKLVGRRDAIGMLTHIDGAPLHYMELDHALATRLPNPAATARFALPLANPWRHRLAGRPLVAVLLGRSAARSPHGARRPAGARGGSAVVCRGGDIRRAMGHGRRRLGGG
jgi:hypothetical protein